MTRPDVPCQEIVECVTLWLDGALDEQAAVEFELHLVTCAHCSRYLEQVRATIAASGRIEDEPIPADVEASLLAAFRQTFGGAG